MQAKKLAIRILSEIKKLESEVKEINKDSEKIIKKKPYRELHILHNICSSEVANTLLEGPTWPIVVLNTSFKLNFIDCLSGRLIDCNVLSINRLLLLFCSICYSVKYIIGS